MENLEQKLEIWKNKLLDLGKRNRLINYKDTKRSNLRITVPSLDELWQNIVLQEKPLSFDYFDDDENTLDDNVSEIIDCRKVVTNQNIREQQRTLRNLRVKAKTAMEEQGTNILYLSFGFLKWSESNHSEQHFLSPLILVPVTLTVASITSPFILGLHEDEIVVNPTLAYKLSNDFGINLPEFTEETTLQDYLQRLRKLVVRNKWEIVDEVSLSLLSFLKMNMYRDLELRRDQIINNPIVRALNGDTTALNIGVTEVEDFNHDRDSLPSEMFQVVDADSSQQDAVLFAKKGASFVLQGPPGTGKSQTITNIIAESLAAGKKVLFVSEKMAALEVVQRRLAKVGLADFCLVLHSAKANKRQVLDQLNNTLKLTSQKPSLSDEAYRKLEALQDYKIRLNDYADAIFTKVMPLNKTIYEANGYLANLEAYEDVTFKLDNILSVTSQQFYQMVNLLERFPNIVGERWDDYKFNPWNGANIVAVSNELRAEITTNIRQLIPKIQDGAALYDQMESQLHTQQPSSYNGLLSLKELLETAECSPKIPEAWIVGDDLTPLFAEIKEHAQTKEAFSALQEQLEQLYRDMGFQDDIFGKEHQQDLFELNEVEQQRNHIEGKIIQNALFNRWQKINDWDKINAVFTKAQTQIAEYNAEKTRLLAVFEAEILSLDYKVMHARFKTDYTSVFKVFKSQYRMDKKSIQGLYKEVVKKISDEAVITTLTKLRDIDEAKKAIEDEAKTVMSFLGENYQSENTDFSVIEDQMEQYQQLNQCLNKLEVMKQMASTITAQEALLKQHYDFLYQGINTNWQEIQCSLKWASEFRSKVEKYGAGADFITWICTNDEKIARCKSFHSQLAECLQRITPEFFCFLDLFDTQDEIRHTSMAALAERLRRCEQYVMQLEDWIDFRNLRQECHAVGMGDYIEKLDTMSVGAEHIVPIFQKRFYNLWLDAASRQYPAVLNFRRAIQEERISKFIDLDTAQFAIAQARIKKKLIESLPALDHFTSGEDEVNILKRELGKHTKIKPIRKLFKEIPNLLLTLKPCLMMSPLSVSLFLEADRYEFDMVIFDEASQVCTENAIGAISRGKQVIIAGDRKQLPPTNFFAASTSSDDDSDEDETDAYESILDEACILPEQTLRWHYRSRHEHLIAFSNAKIYQNNLITFPSNVEKRPNNGVEYIYVPEGRYDRGGKKGNVIEAVKVAEMVFDHFQNRSMRSLGVIAFGEVQQQAIDAALRQKRKERPEYEQFFGEDKEEPFFIKNLENVQGDERDTIIFSIGYAKDLTGKMQMNFGPLSRNGGERRLNVAITRAKYNIKLVGSILPTDIDIDRISVEGPKLLRAYIDFARNGISVLVRENTESDQVEHDSSFEEAVYKFLADQGYKLGTQVGCSGYRIDLAVKHPTISGIYVLGIECDGASYHSSRTARERDRLRQDILEQMGWKIYRVWSTDWNKDAVTEKERLLEAIQKAIAYYEANNTEVFTHQASETIAVSEEFLCLSEQEPDSAEKINPYGFSSEIVTNLDAFSHHGDAKALNIRACITAIIDCEFPVHYELICKKVAPWLGNQKVTSKIRTAVDEALATLDTVTKKGDFYYPKNATKITPRVVDNQRKIEHISADELAEAMLMIASNRVGITREALCAETAKAYNFSRNTGKIQDAMQEAYALILDSGKARELEGKLLVE